MRRPAFFIAACLLAGAVLGRMLALPLWGLAALWAVSVPVLIGVYMHRRRHPVSDPFAVLVACAAVLVLGAAFRQAIATREARLGEVQVRALSQAGLCRIQGTVAAEPLWRGEERERLGVVLRDVQARLLDSDGVRMDPAVDASLAKGGLACRVQVWLRREAAAQWRGREMVRGERLEVVAVPLAPSEASHASLFDYRAYLRNRGIGAQAYVWRADRVRLAAQGEPSAERRLFGVVAHTRRAILARVDRLLPADRAALLRAVLLGDTGGLSPATREAFVRAGVAHVFAVSGLHTALLALLVYGLCRLVAVPRRTSAWLMIACLAVFSLLVGFRPSVVRAAVMAFFLAMPILRRRAMDRLQALSLAAACTMLVDSQAPFRSDFQFSYLCVFGILTLAPWLRGLLSVEVRAQKGWPGRRLAHLWNQWAALPLALVVAIQLATLPLLSIYYQRVSLVSALANPLCIPLAALALKTGWLMVALGPVAPVVESLLAPVVSWLAGAMLGLVDVLAAIPGASAPMPPMAWWVVGAYYLVLFTGAYMMPCRAPGESERGRARLLLRAAVCVVIAVWWPVLAALPHGDLECVMLDVGQGDCVVLHTPSGRTIMVDTGPDHAAPTVLGYLRVRCIGELAALVLTHPDADHIGAADEILEGVYVDRVMISARRADTTAQRDLERALEAQGAPVGRVHAGMRLRGLGRASVRVLSPAPRHDATDSTNDLSVVLRVAFGRVAFLLTGDAGRRVERELLRRGPPEELKAQVLKVSHHGSATATAADFLDVVEPEVALVSVGRRNPYGHPHPEVLERLERAGATVLRTDRDGTIELRTDGARLRVRTHRRRAAGAISP